MTTLICNGTGNLTGSTTFAAAELGALALNLIRNTTASLATASSVTSATFTVTNAKVIDGALLWLQTSGTVGTGTFKVDLQKGGVSQASVTVNKSDLPDSTNTIPVPVFFKFTGTATGDGGSNWTLVLTTTSGTGTATITYNINAAGATNLTRALRTTTAATPAAADDLYVVGELTGAGTHTSRTVTMDSTAATAYGNGSVNSTTVSGGCIQVSNYGTLSFGTSASTNYILRVNGDLIVYQFGTFNIGSSGAEIPRTSTAVLEFQQASTSGDFGLRCLSNSTVNAYGLSRTSGKNIVQCKLTADVTSNSVTASDTFTVTNCTLAPNAAVDATGVSLMAGTLTDSVTNATHSVALNGTSLINTTQVGTVWLARGSGTNNRFVRVTLGNNPVQTSVSNGLFSDIDLQAGTAGTVTAIGNGTATSVSITAVGGGYLIRIVGKVSTAGITPYLLVNICSAAGTTSFAGANNTAIAIDHMALVTASSISDTTFSVDTDTGWLSGDAIIVASTTRSGNECEAYPLNANAGASSMVSGLYPFGTPITSVTTNNISTHSGTTPTQAEVGLLTRNVRIRSTSTTLLTYVYCTALSTVTFSWVEIYYVGPNITNKRGIEIDAGASSANAKSFTFCSLHDSLNYGFIIITTNGGFINTTISNTIEWNLGATGIFLGASTAGNADWTFSNNLIMKTALHAVTTYDLSGTISGNALVGAAGRGFDLNQPTIANITIGTFDSNTVHSCGTFGFITQMTNIIGTISNLTAWRNTTNGVNIFAAVSTAELIFNNLNLFGNPTGINVAAGDALTITGSGYVCGDSTFACGNAIIISVSVLYRLDITGMDTTGGTSIYVPPTTNDFNMTGPSSDITPFGTLNNCKLGAPTTFVSKTTWGKTAYVAMERYGQVAGDHRTEMKYGQLKTDSTLFNTATPAMRMTPNNASNKLASAPKYQGFIVPVASGVTKTISVYIRKSAVGDGTAYTGNQPRLIQRANNSLGQNADVVLATYSAGTGAWNQLSAACSSPTDDGAFEFIVDCDGTVGWVNVDDWAVA